MKKTSNYFIISNYKTIPTYLLDYCCEYIIYDQSESCEIKEGLAGLNFIESKHTGHNITDYFSFFIDNYNNLPEFMALIKGNIIDRHVSKDFFDRVYDNKYYTFLYENRNSRRNVNPKISFLSSENEYFEINNSWYVPFHPHRYFFSFNEFLKFIYIDPVIPVYCHFSPGSCYIISKNQVLKNSKQFYSNLNKIISYTIEPKFPSEAHQIERMLHLIFSSNYEMHEYMNDEVLFDEALSKQFNLNINRNIDRQGFINKIKSKYNKLILKR